MWRHSNAKVAMMDALAKLLETESGLLLLLLLSPTIALGVFGFLYYKSMNGNSRAATARPKAVPLVDYDALSSMRKEQRAMSAAIHKVSERLARIEERLE